MKPLPLILVVLIAAGTGVAGGWLGSRCAQCSSGASAGEGLQADIRPQGEAPTKPTLREAELVAKVENLERALDAIHQDVSELRAGNSRTVAVAVEPEKAPIDQDSVAFAAAHKTAIKAVIEEERAEQARKAEEERKQRDIQQTQQRADRTAQRVGLNPAQTKQLEGFYEQQRVRMEEFRGTMQAGGPGDPQSMRQTFQEFRTWSENELTVLYGSELAGKIMEEGGGFGMGRGGQGMFGGGPGADRQGAAGAAGGGGGGGGRRARAAASGTAPTTVPDGAGAPPAGGGGGG